MLAEHRLKCPTAESGNTVAKELSRAFCEQIEGDRLRLANKWNFCGANSEKSFPPCPRGDCYQGMWCAATAVGAPLQWCGPPAIPAAGVLLPQPLKSRRRAALALAFPVQVRNPSAEFRDNRLSVQEHHAPS